MKSEHYWQMRSWLLNGICSIPTSEWERQRLRVKELVASLDTTDLPNDDDSLALFKETRPSPTLMQVRSVLCSTFLLDRRVST